MKHTLSREDQERIIKYCYEKDKGFAEQVCDENLMVMRIDSFAGELAFCRLFGLRFDWETFDSTHDKADTVWNGHVVDVKQTKYEHGVLFAPPRKIHNPAVIFSLMVGSFPTYEFRGWSWKHELFMTKNLTELCDGKPPVFAMKQSELRMNPPSRRPDE